MVNRPIVPKKQEDINDRYLRNIDIKIHKDSIIEVYVLNPLLNSIRTRCRLDGKYRKRIDLG